MMSSIPGTVDPGINNCPALDRDPKSSPTGYPCGIGPDALYTSRDVTRTTYIPKYRTGAVDPILRVGTSSGVVKHEIIKDPIIEYGPEIRNRGSHNNYSGSHDNKSIRRNL